MVRSDRPHCSAAVFTEKLIVICASFLDFLHRMAQTCVDMKLQHHINAVRGQLWPRPSRVTLHDGSLRCAFEPAKYYDLQDSYCLSPHAQFLNAWTDLDMCAFVRAWGPLSLRLDQPGARVVSHALPGYHASRRWLAALLGLMNAIEDTTMERERLQEYVAAAEERQRCSDINPREEPSSLFFIRTTFSIQEPVAEWAAQAKMTEIRAAIVFIVETSSLSPLSTLRVLQQGKKSVVRARLSFFTLEDALQWMVWYDVYRRDPLYCCQECRTFFKSESKHERKFCNNSQCAKRVAARNWRRKQLAMKRLAKEEVKGQKTNVTHKTR